MAKKKKSPAKARLTNFVCVDKERLHKELTDFRNGVKTKEVEAMRRAEPEGLVRG